MPAEDFRINYALSLVDAFAPGGHEKGFARIARQDVVDGLRGRIKDPWKQNQSGWKSLRAGRAALLRPRGAPRALRAICDRPLQDGRRRLGKLHVKPSAGCRAYAPPASKIHPVDWIALASLRDSENSLLDYSSADDTGAGITMPHSLASWFNQIGWRGVRNRTNVFFVKGHDEVDDCVRDFNSGRRVCLFINKQMLDPLKFAHHSVIPDHWVVLTKSIAVQNGAIKFEVYSWGRLMDIPTTGSYPLGGFYRNFYGFVSSTPTYGF